LPSGCRCWRGGRGPRCSTRMAASCAPVRRSTRSPGAARLAGVRRGHLRAGHGKRDGRAAGRGRHAEHARVVVCAGRGTAPLARGAGLPLPVRQGARYRVRGEPPARLACLQDGRGACGEAGAYTDPLPGNRPYAVGLGERPVDEDGSLLDAGGLTAAAQRTTAYVGRALPGLEPRPFGPATAGSPSCHGAPTASPCGRPMDCSSSPATTSSSMRRRSAAPSLAPRSATASRQACARKPSSAPRSSRRAADDRPVGRAGCAPIRLRTPAGPPAVPRAPG
jgi:hypothetical protein